MTDVYFHRKRCHRKKYEILLKLADYFRPTGCNSSVRLNIKYNSTSSECSENYFFKEGSEGVGDMVDDNSRVMTLMYPDVGQGIGLLYCVSPYVRLFNYVSVDVQPKCYPTKAVVSCILLNPSETTPKRKDCFGRHDIRL